MIKKLTKADLPAIGETKKFRIATYSPEIDEVYIDEICYSVKRINKRLISFSQVKFESYLSPTQFIKHSRFRANDYFSYFYSTFVRLFITEEKYRELESENKTQFVHDNLVEEWSIAQRGLQLIIKDCHKWELNADADNFALLSYCDLESYKEMFPLTSHCETWDQTCVIVNRNYDLHDLLNKCTKRNY